MLLLTACTGSPGSGGRQTAEPPANSAGVPARDQLPPAIHSIPFPDDRTATGLTEYLISGANAELQSAGAVPNGPALVLDAAGSGSAAEWALYRFNPGVNQQDSVSVLLDDTATTGAFIGLANYSTQRWDFSGPYTGQKSFLTDSADHLSPGGSQWIAVLVPGGNSATVSALSVRTINPDNLAPTAALEAAPLGGNAPLLVQFDASGSFDPDGSIIEYAWDFNGDGLLDGYSYEPQASWTYTAGGIYSASVRVTDDQLTRSSPASVEITVNVLGNSPPTVDLQADVTSGNAPLTVNFDASASGDPDGSIARYDWDLDGNGIWEAQAADAQVQHIYTIGGVYTARVRVTDNLGAQQIAELAISVNLLPTAVLTTLLAELNPGEFAFLDASASSDHDGSIADYEWDFNSNGMFSELGAEEDERGNASTVWPASNPGPHTLAVRVTDDSGGQATAELTLTVRGWLTLTVDAPGNVGVDTSLAVVSGRPAISYYDSTNADLKYAWSSTADGSSGWTTLAVDTPGNVGAFPSLALVNGKPAISYRDDTNADLKYAYSSAVDGSGGWNSLTVDSAGGVGIFTSLAVVNGKPAISYFDQTNADLKYAWSSTADGSGGWTALAVDEPGSVGSYTSLAVINGRPAISYWDTTNLNLKYALSSTAQGSNPADWNTLTVDAPGNVGNYTSLALVNGRPAISYFDETNGDLKYAYSSTADGGSGWTAITVDAPGDVGFSSSLAVVNGRPAISYYDDSNFDLKYAYSSTADGGSGWTAITVDAPGSVGFSSSLAVVNGRPAISYFDDSNLDLKYAVLYE